eukprot:m.187044 g.187044  ORF g.187044 m.187044 type:complete len:72 (-) comp16957_c0_seq1:1634-1849(-)
MQCKSIIPIFQSCQSPKATRRAAACSSTEMSPRRRNDASSSSLAVREFEPTRLDPDGVSVDGHSYVYTSVV